MPEDQSAPTEVQHVLEQAVLDHYPNPESTDCAGTPILEQTAQQSLPPEASHWMHIIHRSPCYRASFSPSGMPTFTKRNGLPSDHGF